MQERRRRPPSSAARARDRAAALSERAPTSAVAVFDAASEALRQREGGGDLLAVPAKLRCGAALAAQPWAQFSLDDLFPGAGLGECFDSSRDFRDALRLAARRDLVDPSSPTRYDKRSSAQGAWRRDAFPELTQALREALGAGAPTGEAFVGGVVGVSLPGGAERCAVGHFIEIVGGPGASRVAAHAWHQDRCGDASALTVTLGFPAADAYDGAGCFSHLAQLSHLIAASPELGATRPREFEPIDFESDDRVPEAAILRPSYARGKEILAYSDARTIHSAPDIIHRCALWRFM